MLICSRHFHYIVADEKKKKKYLGNSILIVLILKFTFFEEIWKSVVDFSATSEDRQDSWSFVSIIFKFHKYPSRSSMYLSLFIILFIC